MEPPRGQRSQHELHLSSYPRNCPQCGGALPATRRRFPLTNRTLAARRKIMAGGIVVLLGPVACALIWYLTGSASSLGAGIFGLFAGPVAGIAVAERGWRLARAGLEMPRFYCVTCERCGGVFYVDSQGL